MSTRSINLHGTIRYKNEKGELHRIDGPAIENTDGYKEWCINGQTHREDGPAVVYPNGDVQYRLNSIHYSKEEWETKVIKLKLGRLKDL